MNIHEGKGKLSFYNDMHIALRMIFFYFHKIFAAVLVCLI